MSLLPRILIGQVSNDGQGDRPRVVGQKINEAFETLEGLVDPSPAIAAANQAAGSAQSAAESLLAIGNSLVAAEASAEAADLSAQAAAASEQNAATSKQKAATSEDNAAISEGNASGSADTASTQAGIATAQAGTATTQAGIATTQAGTATTQAGIATTQAGIATTQAGIATTQAGIATTEASRLQGTSASSVAIGTGSKSFTTQASKAFDTGTNVTIVSDANPTANRMFGKSTAYDSGTGALTVNVVAIEGSGTHTDWTIYGRSGEQGAPAAGTGDFVGIASSGAGNIVTFGDTTGKLAADSGKAHSTDGTLASNSDAKIPTEKAVKTYADTKVPSSYLDTDTTLAANSDSKVATQKATKAYADSVAATATSVASIIHAASGKTTPVDADELGLIDSAASNVLKKLTWANLKSTIKAAASGFWAGSNDATFLTPKTVADAAARVSLTSGSTINTDCSAGRNFKVTLGHNATFAKPTNMRDGAMYTWQINQPSSGGPYTGAFNAAFEFPSTPTLSTAASKKDLVSAMYDADADVLVARFSKGS